MPLTEDQVKFVNFVEQWWHRNERKGINYMVPTGGQLAEGLNWHPSKVAAYTRDKKCSDALGSRGITLSDVTRLTPQQLATVNLLLDFTDTRSHKVKLKSIGVTSVQYQGWMKQDAFQRYCRQRAEALLGDVQHEAHAALLRNVARGDLNSIKLYYEMTGRWSSKTVSDLNIEFILVKVVEAVQKHVKDPIAIQAVAAELQGLINSSTTPGGVQMPPPVGVLTNGNGFIQGELLMTETPETPEEVTGDQETETNGEDQEETGSPLDSESNTDDEIPSID